MKIISEKVLEAKDYSWAVGAGVRRKRHLELLLMASAQTLGLGSRKEPPLDEFGFRRQWGHLLEGPGKSRCYQLHQHGGF